MSLAWRSCLLLALSALLILLIPLDGRAAQETRTEEIVRRQAEKAQRTRVYQPSRAERAIEALEDYVEQARGLFPSFESVYGGGGFTVGATYRQAYGNESTWDVKGLYSIRSYKLVELGTVSPGHLGGRVDLAARAGWRDATQVAFYGIGTQTSADDRTNFGFSQGYATGLATWRPSRWSVVTGEVGYEDFTLGPGRGSAPSIEQRFSPSSVPGLGMSPSYLHAAGSAAIDWRTSPGYSRTGGYYGVALHDYHDTDQALSFRRIDADVIQHVPLLRETWVLSLHGRIETTLGDDDVAPFFLLPSLGSGSSLRGYSAWRFRDRHSLLTTIEWRWTPNRLGLDMALFYDAGKVAADRDHLDLHDLHTNWGIGARFHGPAVTPLRLDLAKGSEGWRLVFAGSAAF